MGVGNGTACIVVEMGLNIRANHTTECPNHLEHLPGRRHADCIRDTHSVHAHPVNSLVERQQIDEVGPEGVLGREADFTALAVLRSVNLQDPGA